MNNKDIEQRLDLLESMMNNVIQTVNDAVKLERKVDRTEDDEQDCWYLTTLGGDLLMTKHFRACNRETGDTIEFDLGDIYTDGFIPYYPSGDLKIVTDYPIPNFLSSKKKFEMERNDYERNFDTDVWHLRDWLKDYDLYYNHAGQWFLMGGDELPAREEKD